MAFENKHTFNISVTGSKTGEQYRGEFTVKVLLSHADDLARDNRRRELLGSASPEAADARQRSQAEVFSELHVRITKAPEWWIASGSGLTLFDDEPVAEVYNLALKAENKHMQDLKDKATKAQEELKANGDALGG